MEENIVFNTEDVQTNKVMGILAYIGFLFLVPLLGAKDSQYSRFHANQGLVLFILEVALSITSFIITFVVTIASLGLLTAFVSAVLYSIIGIFSLVFMIIGILNACSGEPKKLPVIGNITLIK